MFIFYALQLRLSVLTIYVLLIIRMRPTECKSQLMLHCFSMNTIAITVLQFWKTKSSERKKIKFHPNTFTHTSPLFWSSFSTKTKRKTTPTLKEINEEQQRRHISLKTKPLRINYHDNHRIPTLDITIRKTKHSNETWHLNASFHCVTKCFKT